MHSQTAEVFAKWESIVTPILENDRKYKVFFVPNGKMNFTELVCDDVDYEVSRVILAALMVSNTGDVKLDDSNAYVTDDFPIILIEK